MVCYELGVVSPQEVGFGQEDITHNVNRAEIVKRLENDFHIHMEQYYGPSCVFRTCSTTTKNYY